MVVFALLTAGCVDVPEADPGTTLDAAIAEGAPGAPLGLAGTSCWEGGGHSVHPIVYNPLPEPWMPADVIGDVGAQLVYSEMPDPANPIPQEGTTMGNWHATVLCEGWTLDGVEKPDLLLGYVGMKVEPPPFDDASEPASHHYLVTVIATNDDDLLARLQEAGYAAIRATAEKMVAPDGTVRVQMFTDGNGEYDSLFRPKEMGAMEATRIRIWYQSTPDGHGVHGHEPSGERPDRAAGEFRPIALDLVSTGGTHIAAEGQGYFSHSGTAHHAPLPGAYGQAAAFGHVGFDRVVEWGPRPDVVLAEAYLH